MDTIDAILRRIHAVLANEPLLETVKFVLAYPKGFRQNPLSGAVVAVGLDGLEMEPGAFSGYCGTDPQTGGELFGRRASLRVRLELYVPQSDEGTSLFELYTAVADCLLAEQLGGALLEIGCAAPEWNRQFCAYLLPVTLKIKTMLGSARPQEPEFDELIVKGVM